MKANAIFWGWAGGMEHFKEPRFLETTQHGACLWLPTSRPIIFWPLIIILRVWFPRRINITKQLLERSFVGPTPDLVDERVIVDLEIFLKAKCNF